MSQLTDPPRQLGPLLPALLIPPRNCSQVLSHPASARREGEAASGRAALGQLGRLWL